MLTLKRREGEELIFEVGDIEFAVIVNEVRGAQVSLTVDAPEQVVVLRDELLEEG